MNSPTAFKIHLRQRWERIFYASERSRTKLSGGQISERSWAKKVSSFQELPKAFQPFASDLLLDVQTFPYSVLTPTFEGFWKRENEKLLFSQDDSLYILENDQRKVNLTSYELENIYRIEFGKILLDAWIYICGLDNQGHYSTTYLRFNSVTDFLFNPFIELVRNLEEPTVPGNMLQEREKFSPLESKHFKFMNYARKSLLPRERVEQYLLQPELDTDRLKIFGKTLLKRTICITQLLIQTDRELILICDDESSPRWNATARYGGICNYVPLDQLRDLVIEDTSDRLINLTIKLPAEDNLCVSFSSERRPELERFVQKVEQTIKLPVL